VVFIDLHPSGTPQLRRWGTGWPNGQGSIMVPVVWSNGASPAGGVRTEIADLVKILGDETIRRGYAPRTGWCWGYDNRAIAGTNIPSNHSWGLAVDINAPTNPRQPTLRTDMPSWMPKLWNAYGFRWGGDYPAGIDKDAMHYEFMGDPLQAAAATAQARFDLLHRQTSHAPGDAMLITRNDNGTLSYWLVLPNGAMVGIAKVDADTFTGPEITVTGDKAWAAIVAAAKPA
jgi:hypothetical protein